MFDYAIMLITGKEIERDLNESAKYLQMATKKEHKNALFVYSVMLQEEVEVVSENNLSAEKFLKLDNEQFQEIYNYSIFY